MLKLLGYSAEEYVGHRFAEFFVDPTAFDEFWDKLMRHEEVYDHPAELRCKNGAIAHVVIHSNGLWEDGHFIYSRTFIHDVTERRAMERALKQAHDELEKRVQERTNELRKKNIQVLKQAEILDMTNQGLRELSARLMRVQDDERRRIARDLHDSTGQSLALLSMNLSAMEAEASKTNPALLKSLTENEDLVRHSHRNCGRFPTCCTRRCLRRWAWKPPFAGTLMVSVSAAISRLPWICPATWADCRKTWKLRYSE